MDKTTSEKEKEMKIDLLLVIHIHHKDGTVSNIPTEMSTKKGEIHDDISDVVEQFEEDFSEAKKVILHQVITLP